MDSDKYIPLDKCIKRGIYRIRSRNLSIGLFDGEKGFIGIRTKFGDRYLFTEYHHDSGAPFGTVHPIKLIGELPPEIEVSETIGDLWVKLANGNKKFGYRAVTRRDLAKGELPHGGRQGFVDTYVDSGERLPSDEYPFLRQNEALFKYLDAIKIEE